MTKLRKVLKFMNYKKNRNFTWKSFMEKFGGTYPTTETNYLSMLVKAEYVVKVSRGKYKVVELPSENTSYGELKREIWLCGNWSQAAHTSETRTETNK